MKLVTFLLTFLSNGEACKEASKKMSDSFTGIESYWNPAFKG